MLKLKDFHLRTDALKIGMNRQNKEDKGKEAGFPPELWKSQETKDCELREELLRKPRKKDEEASKGVRKRKGKPFLYALIRLLFVEIVG